MTVRELLKPAKFKDDTVIVIRDNNHKNLLEIPNYKLKFLLKENKCKYLGRLVAYYSTYYEMFYIYI